MTSLAQPATLAWTAEVRRDTEFFAALRPEWNDLFSRCSTATPFQSHAWLESWWRTYGTPGRLRVATVRHDGRLVAAGAFRFERRLGAGVLVPLGGDLSDFTDVLVDDGAGIEAAGRLARVLLADGGWQVLDFPETRPGAVAGSALSTSWPGRRHTIAASLCLELPSSPMEDLVKELPAHTRKTVKRRLNQLTKLDLDVRSVPAQDADRGVAELLRLHKAQWAGRGGNPVHMRPEFAAHLTGALRGMIAAGEAELLEYRFEGRLRAANLVIVGRDLAGGYLYGADPDLREQIDITTLLISTTLPLAHRRGCAVMSMLRGAEPYKERWRPTSVVNERILLARPGSARAAGYLAGIRTARSAVRFAKERLPWVRTVRDRVRVLIRKNRS